MHGRTALGRGAGAALGALIAPFVRRLPGGAARSLGTALGDLVRLTDPLGRRTARVNLKAALPELGGADRALWVRRIYRHQGRVGCDNLTIAHRGAVAFCQRLSIVGWEHLEQAAADGRGVVLLSTPLGNPEGVTLALALYLGPLRVADDGRPPAPLERPMRRLQHESGIVTIPPFAGSLARTGEPAAEVRMLLPLEPDEHGEEGIRVDFFGGTVRLSPLPARVCGAGAPLVPVSATAVADGGLRLVVDKPLTGTASGTGGERELLGRAARWLEGRIRACPEQWPWMSSGWGLQ